MATPVAGALPVAPFPVPPGTPPPPSPPPPPPQEDITPWEEEELEQEPEDNPYEVYVLRRPQERSNNVLQHLVKQPEMANTRLIFRRSSPEEAAASTFPCRFEFPTRASLLESLTDDEESICSNFTYRRRSTLSRRSMSLPSTAAPSSRGSTTRRRKDNSSSYQDVHKRREKRIDSTTHDNVDPNSAQLRYDPHDTTGGAATASRWKPPLPPPSSISSETRHNSDMGDVKRKRSSQHEASSRRAASNMEVRAQSKLLKDPAVGLRRLDSTHERTRRHTASSESPRRMLGLRSHTAPPAEPGRARRRDTLPALPSMLLAAGVLLPKQSSGDEEIARRTRSHHIFSAVTEVDGRKITAPAAYGGAAAANFHLVVESPTRTPRQPPPAPPTRSGQWPPLPGEWPPKPPPLATVPNNGRVPLRVERNSAKPMPASRQAPASSKKKTQKRKQKKRPRSMARKSTRLRTYLRTSRGRQRAATGAATKRSPYPKQNPESYQQSHFQRGRDLSIISASNLPPQKERPRTALRRVLNILRISR